MNVSISYDNLIARVDHSLPEDVASILRGSLRYRPDGYQHVYSFKSKRWDGYTYLYDLGQNCFRRGLLNRAEQMLKEYGHTVTTKYIGTSSNQVDHELVGGLIRPYEFQKRVVDIINDKAMGIVVSPTGTGKTVMLALLLNALKRVSMVLVTDVVLLDQMQQALEKYFDQPIGMIGDGEFSLQNITVSTIQSLLSIKKAKSVSAADKRLELIKHLSKVGAVISDEAHLYDSDSVAGVMELFSAADRFYGMSATPYGWAEKAEKRDNLELEQHFGNVIYDTRKANDFIQIGLKVPIYVQIDNRDPLNQKYDRQMKKDRFRGNQMVPDPTANYKECLETEIVRSSGYHEHIASVTNKLMESGNSVFVHAAHNLDFGRAVTELIPGSVFVHGKTPRLERRAIYDAMRRKELLGLVSDVGGTGLDIPSLNALVLGSDLKDIRQLKGRVERADKSPGATKEYGLLIDMHTKTQFLTKHHSIRRHQYVHDNHLIMG